MMQDLIEENMGLVIAIVNRFNPKNSLERERYIQAGRIGLWKALDKFCVERGTKFSPYAWNPIRWEIIKEIRLSTKHKHISLMFEENNGPSYMTGESFWEMVPSNVTDQEKEVLRMRLEGSNFKEISESLNGTRSQTKKLFNSAIKKIRDHNDE